ncbi:MAG: M20/M25/M40 family metallo-hydrolase [Ferruginibacter sp.]
MKQLLVYLLLAITPAHAQDKQGSKQLLKNLKEHIEYLSGDKLEGRRAGSAGERKAAIYIKKHFNKAGLSSLTGINNFLQPFEINDGRRLTANNSFFSGGRLQLNIDYFPLAYSGNGIIKIKDYSLFDTADVGPLLKENSSNPHFDLTAAIRDRGLHSQEAGKKAIILFNTSGIADNLVFDAKDKTPSLSIPVVFVKNVKDLTPGMLNTLQVDIESVKRTGHNVIGQINNNAKYTVVIGAHYDHLGYGEDHNSLYSGKEKQIHNGADDNASGTAALIELACMIRKAGFKNYNYLFVAFSGEELGLFGSKYFVENLAVESKDVNYMINMDMIGRLNDSTHGLAIGGFGTSPEWNFLLAKDEYLKIKYDSSGSGPSDHTSFYRKDIPVLFFFTGSHIDYHKPTDDAIKINYSGEARIVEYIFTAIQKADAKSKLAFLKTRETMAMGKSTFKVSLGIMPDYTFTGAGVRVDGVTDGRPAQKAGMKPGDIITELGAHKFYDVQTYMKALSQFGKGESAKVKVIRGKDELVFDINF